MLQKKSGTKKLFCFIKKEKIEKIRSKENISESFFPWKEKKINWNKAKILDGKSNPNEDNLVNFIIMYRLNTSKYKFEFKNKPLE